MSGPGTGGDGFGMGVGGTGSGVGCGSGSGVGLGGTGSIGFGGDGSGRGVGGSGSIGGITMRQAYPGGRRRKPDAGTSPGYCLPIPLLTRNPTYCRVMLSPEAHASHLLAVAYS